MKVIIDNPDIEYDVGEAAWFLVQDWMVQFEGHEISVPCGFRFDLASIPRFLWPIVGPFELSVAAPLIHDWMYRWGGKLPAGSVDPRREFSRRDADRAFRWVMEEEGVGAFRRTAAWLAVRVFAWRAWRR